MSTTPGRIEDAVARRAPDLEALPLAGGGAEVGVGRTRRVRLTADAFWLLSSLDGKRSVRHLAAELSRRFAREVSPADAATLLDRTLVAHGLAFMGPPGGNAPSPPLRRVWRVTLLRGERVRAFASFLAPLAWPPLSLALVAGSGAALALAAARIAHQDVSAWTAPAGWLAAAGVTVIALLAHEMGHAVALVRAGGEPGSLSAGFTRRGPRLTTELAGLNEISPLARAGVDVAGVVAQWCVLGGVAAAALATDHAPPATALAAGLALAVAALVPVPGSDGRWLLDDLARHDPGDTIRTRVPPRRWLSRLGARLHARAQVARRAGPLRDLLHLMPVFVSASFPDWPPRRLRSHARRHVESNAVSLLDHRELADSAMPDDVRHVRPIRRLLAEGRGAVVCGMHTGPFQYVPAALAQMGCPVACYAATNQQREFAQGWISGAARIGARLEVLSPRSVRDAIRAIRMVREGAMLYVLMDGQDATGRDQHRADFSFLGNDLYMRTGPAWLAWKSGAPIVLASTRYEGVARRVVEFSDPLPPPASDAESAIVARTAEMYAWFEPRAARDSAQWDGWVWPLVHWRATGGSPTATVSELDAARTRVRRALAGDPPAARIAAEPTRVNSAKWGDEHLIVDGPGRRVLVASPLARAVLDAAFASERVARLPARTGAAAEDIAEELARLVLAGLVTLRN